MLAGYTYEPAISINDTLFYFLFFVPITLVELAPEDLTSYLEAFGEALLKDRKLVAYLVAFREADRDNQRVIDRMLRTEQNFLIKEFRLDPSRIKIVDGGYREWRTMELWIGQPGYRPIITSRRVIKFR